MYITKWWLKGVEHFFFKCYSINNIITAYTKTYLSLTCASESFELRVYGVSPRVGHLFFSWCFGSKEHACVYANPFLRWKIGGVRMRQKRDKEKKIIAPNLDVMVLDLNDLSGIINIFIILPHPARW